MIKLDRAGVAMAGLGIKKFLSGETLTADEVNGYLMDQAVCVFETTTARDNAFGGSGEPVLSEGRVCYIKSDNIIQFYDGTQWVSSSQFSVSQNSQVSEGILQLDRLIDGTSGQIIVCNSSGVPTYVTLSGDATISDTGVITVSSNGIALGTDTTGNYVATVAGTTNQITVSGSGTETAAVTLSLPQDIHTSANPTFAGATLDAVQIGVTAAGEIDTSSGNLTLDSAGGTVTIDDILSVSGSAAIAGSASVATNLTVSGSAAVTGAITVGGTITATGNVISHITTASVANSASITAASDGRFIETDSSTAGTIYVTGSGWTVGSQVTIMQMSASTSSASISFPGQTLRGTPLPLASPTVAVLRTQYSSVTLINKGENDWYVIGDLKA